jgi:serine/threonine protein kinase
LVMFLGAVFTNDPPFLLLEHCAGGSLYDRVKRARDPRVKRLTRAQRRRILWEVALGMNCLHSCSPRVLHHDLRPSNVLLTDDLNAKVTAFGLRSFEVHSCRITRARTETEPSSLDKATDNDSNKSSCASASHHPGNNKHHSHHPRAGRGSAHANHQKQNSHVTDEHTERYRFVAPEVFDGAPGDTKADVYAFGLLAFAVLSGHLPFEKIACGWDAARAGAKGARPNLAEVPSSRRLLLQKCWAHDASQRPSFEEIVAELDPTGDIDQETSQRGGGGGGSGGEKSGCVVC